MIEPQIIIIGAGAAGIAAASRLLEKGIHNVLILEAKDRIGGRIFTQKFGDNIVELGAQWCHGEQNNVVYNLAAPHNLLESSFNINDPTKHIFVNAAGEVASREESVEILRIYHKILDDAGDTNHKPGTSLGEYFTHKFYEEIKGHPLITSQKAEQILNWMHKYQNSIECSDTWFDVSATKLKDYWSCEGDPVLNWKTNGYCKVFDLLTKNYPGSRARLPVYEKILLNMEISSIEYTSKDYVEVSTSNGSKFKATSVIFTPSLGVLKEQHMNLFKPTLSSSKIKAIKGLSIGVANKIFLEFPHQWWPKNTGALSFMWSDNQKKEFIEKYGQEKSWLCDVFEFFTVDHQPRLLSGWLVGPNAKYVETLDDQKVMNEFHFILDKFLGHVYDIPRPQTIIRSKWFSDKHFRGSYTFRSMLTERLAVDYKDLMEPIKGNKNTPMILFAGEATHEHYYSTVHGAVESGYREADRLIDFYT
ncbi:hypothetical protein QAD02_022579 [Eretmocerus hayati]|uniref:Uncharacterized protein n=1 Tax=Eretmocerus hayati TaxID=131215 RepID=A0ACC2PT55_9HYME|nr:hypothetical protein QAD02_022579 [Eretmocerus hayati]